MPKYPWKCLNKLFWLSEGSKYAYWSYMLNRFLKMPRVLNKPGFWIWHGCIYKGYAEFQICLIMGPYTSVKPQYALMSLNIPEDGWILLNVPEYAWKWLNKLSDYARFLNMRRYSYNNTIIIVTNFIILEFFPARFVYHAWTNCAPDACSGAQNLWDAQLEKIMLNLVLQEKF